MSESKKKFGTNDLRLALEVSGLLSSLGPAVSEFECSAWCPTQERDANLRHDIECVVANSTPVCSIGECDRPADGLKTFGDRTVWLCRFDLATGEPCAECGGGSAGVRIEVTGEDGGHTRLHLCYEHADRWSCQVEGCGQAWVRAAQYAVYRDGLGYLRCRSHIFTPIQPGPCEAGQSASCDVDGETVRVRLIDAVTEIPVCGFCRFELEEMGELEAE
jgi:hypothetical protein